MLSKQGCRTKASSLPHESPTRAQQVISIAQQDSCNHFCRKDPRVPFIHLRELSLITVCFVSDPYQIWFLGTLTRIWSEEGVRGLYRGLGPTIFGYLPTWAIYFTAYDYFKDLVARQTGTKTVSTFNASCYCYYSFACHVLILFRYFIRTPFKAF